MSHLLLKEWIGLSSPAWPSYSIQSTSFLNIKQNLDYVNYHFGGYTKIFYIYDNCFNIASMGI